MDVFLVVFLLLLSNCIALWWESVVYVVFVDTALLVQYVGGYSFGCWGPVLPCSQLWSLSWPLHWAHSTPTTHTSSTQVILTVLGVALGSAAYSRTALPTLGWLWNSSEVLLKHSDSQVFPCWSGSEPWKLQAEHVPWGGSHNLCILGILCRWESGRAQGGMRCSDGARFKEEENHCQMWGQEPQERRTCSKCRFPDLT